MKIVIAVVGVALLSLFLILLINCGGGAMPAPEVPLQRQVAVSGDDARSMFPDAPGPEAAASMGDGRERAAARPHRGAPDGETVRYLESQVLVDDALVMEAARSVLESSEFERIARAISRRYAADPDVVRSKALYARKAQRHLAEAGATLATFECGLGYCLGEVEGKLGPEGEGALADAVDAGTFALLPWEGEPAPRYRFIFSTDPSVREMQGELAGG
ncbi:hypothetical protein P6166_09065 [Stenotrophomonas sp. HITSZ_GD]|uniref:hypothetical protein n=1 Tax=Stenotrophomonas sp. HITSZ_GD TaxID=3037248 RepID=UPI00240DE048|nr:hypothetical protein [Stenotrophomonas sp. HITSZ_GD]MDG2525501.1 hypothetical protein [Stenotrophomonas sp. HITSZ_GD]